MRHMHVFLKKVAVRRTVRSVLRLVFQLRSL